MVVSRKASCPSGYIRRASYKSKSGKRVKSASLPNWGSMVEEISPRFIKPRPVFGR